MKFILRHCLLLSLILFALVCYKVFHLSKKRCLVNFPFSRRSLELRSRKTTLSRESTSVQGFVIGGKAGSSHIAPWNESKSLSKYPQHKSSNFFQVMREEPTSIRGFSRVSKNTLRFQPIKTAIGQLSRFDLHQSISNQPHRWNNLPVPTERVPTSSKRILIYTTLFGKNPMEIFGESLFESCQVSTCFLTADRSTILQSDAVIFHGRDMPLRLPSDRYWSQRWIYLNRENPHYTWPEAKKYNGVFNWTMTYKRNSDIWVPYGSFRTIGAQNKAPFQTGKNNTAGKSGLVAWATSHCESVGLLRERYVEQLALKIQIDVFGRCKPNRPPCLRGSEECERRLKTYKFYLAFENALCEDYITEKFWEQAVRHEMVPVVMGGADYKQLVPPHSYIDILDFSSVDQLARYLRALDSNSSAYNAYFDWRNRYEVTQGMHSGLCQLCGMLHNDSLPRKVYKDLGKFWSVREDCLRHAETILNQV